MENQQASCASFAGGFVPVGTQVVVVINDREDNDIAMLKTEAKDAPNSPHEAICTIADAYGLDTHDIRVSIYAVVGGADGSKITTNQ